MKSRPLQPAVPDTDAHGRPFSPAHGDVYHPHGGALAQARHVFLAGNGLPRRWQGRERFVVLETGFGLGNNFLALWQAWRSDSARCERLHLVSIERHPLTRDALAAQRRDPELADLAAQLIAAWPPLVHGLHRLVFEDGRVELLLAFGDVQDWLPELVLQVDAVFLDGFAPARNPAMWSPELMRQIPRRCRVGATAATWSAARPVREALAAAGFAVERGAGIGGKRDITQAVYAPVHVETRVPPGRPAPRAVEREAVIVGGGLAGCAAAFALAQHGWRSTLLDRHPVPACEGSGNPAGLFHGTLHGEDGVHARWNRAAALEAQRAVAHAIETQGVPGSAQGLLRLEATLAPSAMQALLDAQGLPSDYVQVLDRAQAAARAGLDLPAAAWFYPGGGWVAPARLAAALLTQAGEAVRWCGGVAVDRLERHGNRWHLLDAQGTTLAESGTVVLANAHDALRLAGSTHIALDSLRGQISGLDLARLPEEARLGPRLPISGHGYVLPAIDGRLWFGATAQRGDPEPALREADHRHNLAQLQLLSGRPLPIEAAACTGRVGWRCTAPDRLPLIGAWPDEALGIGPLQPRAVPRLPGLFAFTGLGSRGLTWMALGARVLAGWVCGSPAPVEASLLDAVDPARFLSRAARRERSLSPPRGGPARG
ncbi:MAG: bifunctional tRNA (5-methylaminomethyl-2-thiouridine)(34)-methyltransferase MnmD/FAD-dependent 5-carboxymethylaminomethyl-2-thiouridine(34) oxidoreductase MnmC [Piscinibacter sp.]|uniref:bifunctional tRNA (5-methylaminomethyl-2-thiouridine)(34)-methyltransferase MnmD/FAD-dependent 5-carboxymethylaminomethyl-2-thiouridine(34) oxidoreductase MnmC n=1 Tax=Piscinibacter sp. TaxID=1903157 RepID=UPI002587032D|nr:bifunctional tRNA (5-methylaminomethyl-2-thiouridine)(34)-methyltransferase MnmD/FAD-dependent 5-carboxymethylaminomethyl-2-thiouridine(34) oxidoreductase MnmC [Piscinibacter sp.]MCW5664103.1 bifunctional tRNA (5-methylaminomethyl-2-thiouridine)(34)-methyltransferase MnmD/FAD-dependent 5-carboxymethylaminomethyl-2-thiouridine(34) oxidoreductase MnmC [Piscinibacter sp.]